MDVGAATEDSPATAALVAVSRVMAAATARTLAGIEQTVTVSQLRVLVMIDSRGPTNLNGVAQSLGVNASNASRTCDKLVSAGLLERRDLEHDRRHLVLSLTPAGKDLVDSLLRARRDIFHGVVRRMGTDEQRVLAESLERFLAAVESAPAEERIPQPDGRLLPWLI